MKKRNVSIALALFAALAVTACGGNSGSAGTQSSSAADTAPAETSADTASAADTESGTVKDGGEFVYGLATEVDNFDPFQATTADAKSIYFNIYEGLVKVQPDGTFAGAVASDYTISDDAKTYTFTIRDGIRFHNGNEVTADDVLYSIQHAIDSGITGYDNIDSFSADGNVITVNLKNPDTDFLADASTAIVPKDSAEDNGLVLNPVGTGPFKFTDYAVQDHCTLEKNTDYWGTPAHLDKVTVKFISGSSDLVVNYQSGAIDSFSANGAIAEQVDKNTSTLNVGNSNAVQLLALNNSVTPFDDVRVRQALSYAVDNDEIIETASYGYGVKIGTSMIPGLSAYFDDSLTDTYDVDDEKAKQLLADAGYADGFTFTCRVPSVYQVHLDTAQVIVNELAKIGVTMNIEQVDWATWLENVYSNRDYEATIISLDGSIASPTAFLSRYVSDAHNNFVNYSSDDYDAAYAKAVAAVDQDERIADFKECEKILTDDAASVYIQDISNVIIYREGYAGYVSYPLYAVDFSCIYQE